MSSAAAETQTRPANNCCAFARVSVSVRSVLLAGADTHRSAQCKGPALGPTPAKTWSQVNPKLCGAALREHLARLRRPVCFIKNPAADCNDGGRRVVIRKSWDPTSHLRADLSVHSHNIFSLGSIKSPGSAPERGNCFLMGPNCIRRKSMSQTKKRLFGSWAALVLAGSGPAGLINPTLHLGGGIGEN